MVTQTHTPHTPKVRPIWYLRIGLKHFGPDHTPTEVFRLHSGAPLTKRMWKM